MGKYEKKKPVKTTLKKRRASKFRFMLIYVLILILAILTTMLCQHVKYKKQIEEIQTSYEEQLKELRIDLETTHEAEIAELVQYYEYGGKVEQIEQEAEYIAKVIYGTARNHSDADQRAVVWCILNRVEHYAYANTIQEVCEQPKQWMGYSEDNPVLEDIYELVLVELKIWYNNDHRPIGNEYIYMSWSSNEILLRDTFEENKNTRYWRMN
jgi:hypothetical protein